LTPENRLRSRNRVLGQLQTRGKVIPSAGGENTQNNVSAVRGVHQSLKGAIAPKSKQNPFAILDRRDCWQFKLLTIPNENKFCGNRCRVERRPNLREIGDGASAACGWIYEHHCRQ
jgi:hypothetical protein